MSSKKPTTSGQKLTKVTERAERWKAEAKTQTKLGARDETWSVVQLRAEVRRRGLAGLSGKPKADLVAALS